MPSVLDAAAAHHEGHAHRGSPLLSILETPGLCFRYVCEGRLCGVQMGIIKRVQQDLSVATGTPTPLLLHDTRGVAAPSLLVTLFNPKPFSLWSFPPQGLWTLRPVWRQG